MGGPSSAFWKGRKVLVTGHTGFKGTWLTLWLLATGADVVGVSNGIPTKPSLFEDLHLSNAIKDLRADVRDLEALVNIVASDKPSVIMHLAAQSLVRPAYDDPVQNYATNVMGTVNILEAARRFGGADLVLIVTSDKCYENRESIWAYREDDAMGGHDPYSSSKGCAELVASSYARSFFNADRGTKVISARAGNVIGGGDWAVDRLIPDLIRGFEADCPVRIRCPSATRPWQHVLEPLSGYLLLCEKTMENAAFRSQGWNFGPFPSAEISVRNLADRVCAMWPKENGWVDVSTQQHYHEAGFLALDSTKARTLLGWHPRWDLNTSLEATLEVYRSGKAGNCLEDLVTAQIRSYEASQGLVV
jgi:CDP-glucose 4,6-dehydratase